MSKKLFNTFQLFRSENEKVVSNVCDYVRSQLSDYIQYEDYNIQYEHTVEYLHELLELYGFNEVKSVHYDSYSMRYPKIEASINLYDIIDPEREIRWKRNKTENKIRELLSKLSDEEKTSEQTLSRIEGMRKGTESSIEEFKTKSMHFNLFTEEERNKLKEILSFDDIEFKALTFDEAGDDDFKIDMEVNMSAYEAIDFMFKLDPSNPALIPYKLTYMLEGEDSDFIEENAFAIWEIQTEYIETLLRPFEDKFVDFVSSIPSEFLEHFESIEKYIYSDEYIQDYIENDEARFEVELFDEDGNYVCDINETHYNEENDNYEFNDFVYIEPKEAE